MMNISIIGSVGVPACYGGFESLVDNLLNYTPKNISYEVYCSSKVYHEKLASYKGAKLRYINLNANGLSSILYDILSIWQARKSDVILILGVSGCLFLPLFRFFYSGKIITNIDGLEWKRAKWNRLARLFLHLSERIAVAYSAVVVGDNKVIVDYIRSTYGKDAVLIEYGADNAIKDEAITFDDYSFIKKPYAITVCRIEPENNIDVILKAFSDQAISIPILLIGNWQKSEYGRKLFSEYSKKHNILLLDPVYDTDRINYLRGHAAFYVHGHSAGGTNPSLIEAMNLGLPVYAFDCAYNRATTEDKAKYWKNAQELTDFFALSCVNISDCGSIMKEIATRRYKWLNISKKYTDLFKTVN
jgi:glycosyltransferase involved in cell wall biosynthesis